MTNERRTKLELLLKSFDAMDPVEVSGWMAEQALTPRQLHEFLNETAADQCKGYVEDLLNGDPSPEVVVEGLLADTLPTTSEEFRRDTARAIVQRIEAHGYQIVGRREE